MTDRARAPLVALSARQTAGRLRICPSTHSYLYCALGRRDRRGCKSNPRGQCRVRPLVSLTYDLAGVSWATTGHVRTRDTTADVRQSATACVRINDVTTNASRLYDLCPTAGRTPPLPDRRCAPRRRSRPHQWVWDGPPGYRDRARRPLLAGSGERRLPRLSMSQSVQRGIAPAQPELRESRRDHFLLFLLGRLSLESSWSRLPRVHAYVHVQSGSSYVCPKCDGGVKGKSCLISLFLWTDVPGHLRISSDSEITGRNSWLRSSAYISVSRFACLNLSGASFVPFSMLYNRLQLCQNLFVRILLHSSVNLYYITVLIHHSRHRALVNFQFCIVQSKKRNSSPPTSKALKFRYS